MSVYELIEKIKRSSPKVIEKILEKEWISDNEDLFLCLELSISDDFNLNLKKIPYIEDEEYFQTKFTFKDFYYHIIGISNLDYDERRKTINSFAENCNANEWNNFYRKILLKQLHLDLPMDIISEVLRKLSKIQKNI